MEPFFACLLILMPACISCRLPGGNQLLYIIQDPLGG